MFCKIHSYALRGNLDGLKKEIADELQRNKDTTIEDIINLRTSNGATPLLLASLGCNLPVVEFLVTNGADLFAHREKNNDTPLHGVIFEIMRRIDDGKDREDCYEIIKILLNKNIRLLETAGNLSFTPLSLVNAYYDKYPEIKQRLLEIVAEIDPNHSSVAKKQGEEIGENVYSLINYFKQLFFTQRGTSQEKQRLLADTDKKNNHLHLD